MSEEPTHYCTCGKICPVCKGIKQERISITNMTFWDLWIQKIFRNLASMKFQWLLLLYVPVIWGMFHTIPDVIPKVPWISPKEGLAFLGGGFVTLALGRIYAKTKLKDNSNTVELDTDK